MTKSGKLSAQDVVNWREVEADDVGAEFYYRAGFNRKDIFGFFAVRPSLMFIFRKIASQLMIVFVTQSLQILTN